MESGSRLGHYEIISSIGKGGMGEVWKARDTRLGREVAIKILPPDFEKQEGWLPRFEREAKLLASLNHPNIAAIYGFDRDQGLHFLVLELVGGETLAERLQRGAIPIEESLTLARQITDALDAAHERGITHRDLKPANIKVTDEGVVKILDFGLARGSSPDEVQSDPENSPTMSLSMTREGVILGTAAYMAPEQARGKRVDRRADIFAFGVVLYEMTTGKRLFQGSDLTETIASVVMRQPDFEPAPPQIRRLLSKCLEKDPRKRLRDIGDVWELLEEPQTRIEAGDRHATRQAILPWALAAVLGVAVVVMLVALFKFPQSLPAVVRFEIHAPRGSILPVGTPSISPNGKLLAYVVQDAQGVSRIHVRPIDVVETRALPGTELAAHPFWSPDGNSLAFGTVARSRMRRIELAGGDARDLTGIGGPWHGTWNQHGEILGLADGAVVRFSDQGGTSKRVEGGDGGTFPAFLSDGKRYLVRTITDTGSSIELATLGSDKRTVVLENVLSAPVFAPTPSGKAYLLFLKDADLMAQEFDEVAGKVVGNPVLLVRRIGRVANPAVMPAVGVSPAGILVYQSADEEPIGELTWVDRSGRVLATLPEEVSVQNPVLSPDGAFVAGERASGGRDIWVTHLERKTATRITFDDTLDTAATWSNDGKRVAFRRAGKGILAADAQGGGTPELLTETQGNPLSWSPDGKYLLYGYERKLFLLEIGGGKKTIQVGSPNGISTAGYFSPDGRYIAYLSTDTGRNEVFVQPVPPGTGRTQISVKGAVLPRWGNSGKELFFVSADGYMTAVDVHLGETISAGTPRPLFLYTGRTGYAVTRDGQRFLIVSAPKSVDTPITVVMNWWVEVEQNK